MTVNRLLTDVAKFATFILVDHNGPFCYNIGIVTIKERKMAKLLITTQVYENYGAHAWDGAGECPEYWKAKGGNDYVVKNFKGKDVTIAVMALRDQIEQDSPYFREHIVDFNIVADDYLTQFERDQLEYDGSIMFPARELEFA